MLSYHQLTNTTERGNLTLVYTSKKTAHGSPYIKRVTDSSDFWTSSIITFGSKLVIQWTLYIIKRLLRPISYYAKLSQTARASL